MKETVKNRMGQLTPMLRQYLGIKGRYPDAILFFRMGDFYEMFFEDAQIASRILGITLTARGAYNGEKVPMCGVPHHASKSYIARLIDSGRKVAICDQDTVYTRYGAVQLEITVSKSTITDVTMLQEPNTNSYDLQIDHYVVPILIRESISAQSAHIQMISGATYTSTGYVQSLQSAIDKAGI